MDQVLLSVSYIIASILFIMSLRGLSGQETAQRGNLNGVIGMAIAVGATALSPSVHAYALLVGVLVIGAGIGAVMASRVQMTAMPELVALLHSFVGAAAVLVGFASYLGGAEHGSRTIMLVELHIDVLIGAITFTGSIIAFLKLRGTVSGKPLLLPGRHLFNAAMALACIGLGWPFLAAPGTEGLMPLLIMAGVAGVLGAHLVLAIGGADMPVVVSLLNSYSGWTAAAAGFMLSNDLLIITGALVGSSGAILSYIMCKAMNRSIWNVIFGGFGGDQPKATGPAAVPAGEVREIGMDDAVAELAKAREVVIVPGYGMAVARAQHAVKDLMEQLKGRGARVRFAIHPVAGRLPGHMNVLLAEAAIPYDIVLEMEDINDDLPKTDVVLVIGANDIVNPSAETDASSPIYGMPVLQVWNSKLVVISKRSRGAGYAGVDNPLFYKENSRMLLGDARKTMEEVVTKLKQHGR
ncbi:MAG: NAD(P)(+) transhydrogenase (Re/Si-specific) subunit beta [Deltaproteobacteria bacterium]|nr:NAD(P)(+) transhydrogenase (Re/Si-specific) subunit beta [Deltaproteobacteria bacterium]